MRRYEIKTAGKPLASNSHATSVLIVDDDPDFLELLSCQIGRIAGVHIDVAHSPAEALEMLTAHEYELVVSDWEIETSTGPEVLSKADVLIADPFPVGSKTPVMFISGSDKVGQTQKLSTLNHFEPVSFLRKSCGTPLIGLLAEHILARSRTLEGVQSW